MAGAKTLGERLRLARKAAGLAQKDVARFLDCRIMTVSNYELGKVAPRVDWLEDAAKVLHVDPAWLLTGQGEGPADEAA